MKKYYCERCNYETNIKCNYKKHLLTQRHIIISSNLDTNQKINDKLLDNYCDSPIYDCKHCYKKFKHASSLSRHIKHICKKNIHHNDNKLYFLNKESNDIQLEIDKLNKKIFDVTKL